MTVSSHLFVTNFLSFRFLQSASVSKRIKVKCHLVDFLDKVLLHYYMLKSVHFKKTVVQSSFLSKVAIFAEIKTKSAKMKTLLKEMRITHLSS